MASSVIQMLTNWLNINQLSIGKVDGHSNCVQGQFGTAEYY
jgi:hypothetical protein